MTVLRTTMAVAVVAILTLASAARITASEELTRAKGLYQSAAYDDALTVLNGISDPAEAVEVHHSRGVFMSARVRRADAQLAMATRVCVPPLYHLPEEETSPRVRAMFAEVRQATLPGIVQRAYADAKAAFDRTDPAAAARFDRVLELRTDPDVAADPSLADLSTVAAGFRDLSKAAAAPPPVIATTSAPVNPPATTPRPTPPAAPPAASPSRSGPTADAVSTGIIVPPFAISQTFPQMQTNVAREWDGEVELVIDVAGKVISARMTKSINPSYDVQLLRAARNWTYRPATKDGVPTQMLKLVTVHLDSRPECSGRVAVNCRQTSR
jgi:hypothetical protein